MGTENLKDDTGFNFETMHLSKKIVKLVKICIHSCEHDTREISQEN